MDCKDMEWAHVSSMEYLDDRFPTSSAGPMQLRRLS